MDFTRFSYRLTQDKTLQRVLISVSFLFQKFCCSYYLNVYFNVVGSVRADNLPYLLSIDDASFGPAGVLLSNNVNLFQCQDCTTNLSAVITQLASKGANISSVATASGKNVWVAVRTADEFTHTISGPGIISF
jgi:hypothetical protein